MDTSDKFIIKADRRNKTVILVISNKYLGMLSEKITDIEHVACCIEYPRYLEIHTVRKIGLRKIERLILDMYVDSYFENLLLNKL